LRRRITSAWELEHIQRHLDELFELLGPVSHPPPAGWAPSVDLLETPGQFLVRVDVPGVAVDDLLISLRERDVRIAGRKLPGPNVRSWRCHHMERGFGSFSLELRLPGAVEASRAGATLRSGVLEVRLPRREEPVSGIQVIRITNEDE
jgi:HSP20 family protein